MGSEWILGRLAGGVWIGFDWLRIGTVGVLLWMRWWTFGFLRHGDSSCIKVLTRHFIPRKKLIHFMTVTERRGWVINTPSYSGGPGFKSRLGDRLSWVFVDFFSPFSQKPGFYLNQATSASFHTLSDSSFTYHPFIRRYVVLVTKKALLNKLQINK
jgi:hypothetical protein